MLVALVVTIIMRCVFRIVELSGGFNDPPLEHQTAMALEGGMISIAIIALVAFHP